MPCNFSYEEIGATMSGIVMIRAGSETDLQAAVAFAGPVTVAVDASSTEFRVGTYHNYLHSYIVGCCVHVNNNSCHHSSTRAVCLTTTAAQTTISTMPC